MPNAAATQNTIRPKTGETWRSTPAAAPGNPTCDSMCAAKLWPRRTTKQPAAPARIATSVPAIYAFCMKWNCRSSCRSARKSQDRLITGSSEVVMADGLVLPDDHQPTVAGRQDVDRRAVEPGQDLCLDHVQRLARDKVATRDVDHAIHERKDRIDVVRHEQHCHALLVADRLDQTRDRLLVVEVKAVQRLVESQHPGPGDERLGDQDALLLSTGQLADRPLAVSLRVHEPDHLLDAQLLRLRIR